MKERWRVVKEAKASGNSGSVYVPREWIGQSVEIRLFNAEEIVLEALLPYIGSILGIYICGPHAAGTGSPEEDIDVLVVSDKEISLEGLDGVNCTVLVRDAVDEYVRLYPGEYAEMVAGAVAIMNGSLLEELKARVPGGDAADEFDESLKRSLAIARSLAREGDHASAAYALMQRLKDHCALTSEGKYSYDTFEEYAAAKGITKEKFRQLYEAYEAKRHERAPEYKVSAEDVAALLKILEEVASEGDEASGERAVEEALEKDRSDVAEEEITRDYLLEKARKYREKYGSGAL